MSLSGLLAPVVQQPTFSQLISSAGSSALNVSAPAGLQPFVAAALASSSQAGGAGVPVLVVTATAREAEQLAATLCCLIPPHSVAVYPAWETLPHERLSPRAETVGQRMAVLRRLAHPSQTDPATGPISVLVTPVRSVLQPQLVRLGEIEPVAVIAGDVVELDVLADRLTELAYARVELVSKRGEFALRGGIMDVFPPTEEHPLRVEFFGDEIEEIRYFSVADQRSLELAPRGLLAPPCRELLLTPKIRARAAQLSSEHPELIELLAKVAEGIPVEGMESLLPALVDAADELELLLAVLSPRTHVLVCDPERVRARAHDLVATSEEFRQASWAAAAVGGQSPIDVGVSSFRELEHVQKTAGELGMPWWSVGPFAADEGATFPLDATASPSFGGSTERALAQLGEHARDGWAVVVCFAGHGPAQRAAEQLRDAGIGVALVDSLDVAPQPGVVTVTTGEFERGFLAQPFRLALFTEADLTGARPAETPRRMAPKRRNTIDPLQLSPGDYVVHEQHGVGRYMELIRRSVAGAQREYLVLEYAASKRGQPGDRVFVPTDQLDLLTRYVGGEQPTLHRIGGADWQKSKGRARKAVRQIAAELVRLYAARTSTPGHAFAADTPWQRELEDAFAFTETPDQLVAIDDVKRDMEQPHPMDRVISGDVGYGKTEIAVRAAFKAVQDGKQVALLVPTTLLARQHMGTFTERLAQFPVRIAQLSRFQTDAQARKVLEGLADRSVDIVIGTHRLLQTGVRFGDLGLVIVDEEQRFGVEHKEHLKQLRASVDVLTLSATPIPRTLEMSMTGIREMSTIATPPEERHPVLTYVGGYDDQQIAAAIKRELLRDGQIFYVHNRVESIDRAATRIRSLVPTARVCVGHGQMSEDALEQVMLGFWEKRYDVLVCTTIVESGLDIPNANTLIVERADMFGLSQLHQIRGRVGRGRERAYAYFLYPSERPLTETAHERLATIAQHSELGAGMFVAMKDLEIRGAGNLLGGEQSGHIAAVGFDLYVRMVSEAVAEYKATQTGQVKAEPVLETKVDLPINANIPHDYVTGERLRLEMYRKLAEAQNTASIDAVREELADRYGPAPTPVELLLEVAALRVQAREAGVTEITQQGKQIRLAPIQLPESRAMRLARLYPGSVYKQASQVVTVPAPSTARIGGTPLRDAELLAWCRDVLPVLAG
ncbi:MAG: transcription-repair coupling factor [Acidimicrobiales bacterium]|nr:MAG: transcription-repair coupling factor [Acidimicrobiales bacterium]